MTRHFGRFSATSKNHHWASVKWTKSVYLSSKTLLFPHEFSLDIIVLLLHSSIQQMENKFILGYFLNTEHAAGKITGGGVYTGCLIHHWVVVKIMLHFNFTLWGKVHFRSSRGNQILSLKNFGFLSAVKLHLTLLFRLKTFPCHRSIQNHPKWSNLVLLFKSHSSHEVWPQLNGKHFEKNAFILPSSQTNLQSKLSSWEYSGSQRNSWITCKAYRVSCLLFF